MKPLHPVGWLIVTFISIGLTVFFMALGLAASSRADAAEKAEVDMGQIGRYRLFVGDSGRCFKIDTVTRRVWRSRDVGLIRTNFEEIK